MKRVSRALILTIALSALVYGVFLTSGDVAAQRRRRRAPARIQPPSSRIDYTRFLHSTKQHQGACVTCHKIPTGNWRKVREYPDVADYPDHDACVSCHRPQFFKGAKPAICSICHSKVSPRDDERFAFRNPSGRRQFLIEFPHDKHQDVIAQLFHRFPTEEQPRLVKISHRPSNFIAQDRQQYNNCEICHRDGSKPLVTPAGGWVDGITPAAGAFKSEPDNHSYCFSCHWKAEPPVNTQCGDCHKLTNPYELVESPQRISMKFDHNGGGEKNEHLEECTTCHLSITKSAHIKRSEIDVPILACKQCHAMAAGSAPPKVDCRELRGSRVIGDELNCLQADKQYTCSYCHTSNFGKLEPPFSHFTVANKNRFMRKDLK